jgi:hypothetical protein
VFSSLWFFFVSIEIRKCSVLLRYAYTVCIYRYTVTIHSLSFSRSDENWPHKKILCLASIRLISKMMMMTMMIDSRIEVIQIASMNGGQATTNYSS